jgi:hypothetical protein
MLSIAYGVEPPGESHWLAVSFIANAFVCFLTYWMCRQVGWQLQESCNVNFIHRGEVILWQCLIFSMAQQPLVGQVLLIIEASRSHSDTTLGRTPLDEWSARRKTSTSQCLYIRLGRYQWPRRRKRGSAAARMLGLRVRIPHGCLSLVRIVCCQIEVSASA